MSIYKAETTHFCSCRKTWQLYRREKVPRIEALWLQLPNTEDSAMSLFRKYKLWATPRPKYDRTWSPPTSFSVDSEGRKTVLWVNIQLVQRKWVTTGGNCSLGIHSPWPGLRNPPAAPWAAPAQCGFSPLPLQSDLVFSVGRKVLELWTGKVKYSFKLGN